MKYKIASLTIVLLSTFILSYCSSVQSDFDIEIIKGDWCLNKKQINYPKLRFDHNGKLVLSSTGDTIYRYNYAIQGAFLLIQKDKKTVRNKILKLDKDSLVLDGLLENIAIQRYGRCK